MEPMRTLIIAFALVALAGPAAAQYPAYEIDNLRAQQEAAARRAIAQDNELSALQNRLQTEQAVTQLQTQRLLPPRLPDLRYVPSSSGPAPAATLKYPVIPDAALADSNRRVRAASQPPR
jgi:hypothetical protein